MDYTKYVPSILAIVVICGGLILIAFGNDSEIIKNLMIMIISYYFGSSRGSQAKDGIIKDLTECKEEKK